MRMPMEMTASHSDGGEARDLNLTVGPDPELIRRADGGTVLYCDAHQLDGRFSQPF